MCHYVFRTTGKRDEKVQKIYFEIAAPDEEAFSGFTFKIQANMDPVCPCDIIGIHNHGTIKIGDTFTDREPLKMKQLAKGLIQ